VRKEKSMTKRKLRLEISKLPDKALSPNARGGFWARYKAGRKLKEMVYLLARSKMNGDFDKPMEKASLKLTYVFPQRRRRDPDNFSAMGKYIADGLVLAGVIEDDSAEHLVILPVELKVDKQRAPLTIVEVTERNGSETYRLSNRKGRAYSQRERGIRAPILRLHQ
jgi:Holliday junction resolvase RusA-like endonuclease